VRPDADACIATAWPARGPTSQIQYSPTAQRPNCQPQTLRTTGGSEVIHGGRKPNFTEYLHAHGDFDLRIMVLSGEITVNRDGGSTFRAGDHCELPGDGQHATKVGREGVAYIASARSIAGSPAAT
jgi:hypothetical protein